MLLKSGNWMLALAGRMEPVERLDRLAASMIAQAIDSEEVHQSVVRDPDL
jgi:hypothetical protein